MQNSKKNKRSTRKPPAKLALVKQIFPWQLTAEMEFDWPLVLLTTSLTATDYFQFCVNSPTQYDYNNKLGFASLVPSVYSYLVNASGNGPYRRYHVDSWSSKFTFINDSTYPIDIYYVETDLVADDDTQSEMQKTLEVSHVTAAPKGGSGVKTTISTRGNSDVQLPRYADGYAEVGTYSVVPTQRIYQSFFLTQASAGLRYYISVRTKIRVHLFDRYTPN